MTRVDSDTGLDMVDSIFQGLGIDADWSVQEPRGFAWWGHQLRQRVWCDPVCVDFGVDVYRLHAETVLLRAVQDDARTRHLVNTANRIPGLDACVLNAREGTLALRCSVFVHAETFHWLQPLFLHAVALQAARAPGLARRLGQQLNLEPVRSSHPTSGPRPEADWLLSVVDSVYQPAGMQPPPFTRADFDRALEMQPRPWIVASSTDAGFIGHLPYGRSILSNLAETAGADTAALYALPVDHHPELGSGVVFALVLPHAAGRRIGDEQAAALNLTETREWTRSHLLGSWQRDESGRLAFQTFLPSAACVRYAPGQGLIEAMLLSLAVRAAWVWDASAQQCLGHG